MKLFLPCALLEAPYEYLSTLRGMHLICNYTRANFTCVWDLETSNQRITVQMGLFLLTVLSLIRTWAHSTNDFSVEIQIRQLNLSRVDNQKYNSDKTSFTSSLNTSLLDLQKFSSATYTCKEFKVHHWTYLIKMKLYIIFYVYICEKFRISYWK